MAVNVLNTNEAIGSLYNQIISIQTYATPIKGVFSELLEMSRVDGSMYGDKKVFISTDALKSRPWLGDAEAANLLNIRRPKDPVVQELVIDQFRIIDVTIDDYLTKRAFADADSFSQFNSVVLGWIRDTKRIYEATMVNQYVGCTTSNVGLQTQNITLPTVSGDKEAENRLQAQTIAEKMANLVIEVSDISRDFNDNRFVRSYGIDDMVIVVPSKVNSKINKLDLPTIYHKDIFEKIKKIVLPSRYFGTINAQAGTTSGANQTVRSAVEKDYGDVHCFIGDLLPNNTEYLENETYTERDDIAFKLIDKDSLKLMSGFESRTTFFNPISLTNNNYLIWDYNKLDYMREKPFITITYNVAENKK